MHGAEHNTVLSPLGKPATVIGTLRKRCIPSCSKQTSDGGTTKKDPLALGGSKLLLAAAVHSGARTKHSNSQLNIQLCNCRREKRRSHDQCQVNYLSITGARLFVQYCAVGAGDWLVANTYSDYCQATTTSSRRKVTTSPRLTDGDLSCDGSKP